MRRLRRISARHSSVHGTGLFARQPVEAGERLIEYKGEVTSWRRAAARQRSDAGHTFVFGLADGRVIDGSRGGNSARFLNHACEPNCEAIEVGNRVFIHALTAINAGAELFLDYGLEIDGEITDEVCAHYACRCGAASCRRSMLAGATVA
ncbi:SET domain-containing protein [Paraburkholderia terrae]|uniref:SET domain-containing protein-lysine N-methyltransferase n=1 Tax=Paraburkholderia terrae TaxID=311230 RepID=A0ABM7U226_9BURK|nr:SET domain-containing protein-lysine N-methyltransferase [Paraburkholderia terrae]BCZ85292.1 SET domain-containing protein-lysine N-methyltransferase [Paraburkholderia terrae]BDC45594.1 SET domain-containing protein-lysine N-methyltransferase [Paraburkholderia terrae]